jgi:D-alanine-D-alanine ligase-like ATP-grasp enzyme
LIQNEATKRTLASLKKTFEAQGLDYETAWNNIKEACGKTMEIYAPMIQHQVKNLSGGKAIEGQPFQILGFDFLIDQNLKAWILEVNDHPSLNIYFDTAFM